MLVDERHDVIGKLQTHLDKSKLSYQEAVCAIRDLDTDEPIPEHLGDFILAAISIAINIPIIVVKPIIEHTQDANLRPITQYNAETVYLFNVDKAHGTGANLLLMVYNGIDYYAPAVPKQTVCMTRAASTATTQICNAMAQVNTILEHLPGLPACDALSKALSFMGPSKNYIEGACLATGTAVTTNFPVEMPIPQPVTPSAATKMAHKRAAATLKVAPPEKKKRETDEKFEERKKAYKESVAKAASRSTTLEENQCVCGEIFTDNVLLQRHMQNVHIDKNSWKCPHCGDTLGSKSHLWMHVRHHLGKWYYYCNVKYEDEDDLDDKGKPKVKICNIVSDESVNMEHHRETVHSFGRCSVRCRYCDKPQSSNRRRTKHEEVCEDGPTDPSEPTHFCAVEGCNYSCRGSGTISKHMRTDHPDEVGLAAPKRWSCQKCHKEFKSPGGLKNHKCKKGKRTPAAATVLHRKFNYYLLTVYFFLNVTILFISFGM